MKRNPGFTVIELLVVIVVLAVAVFLVFWQKNSLDIAHRDDMRKISINAMYYSLENAYYPIHGYYPDHINSGVLQSVDPDLFADPNNVKIGELSSNYRYTPLNCSEDKCKSYKLQSNMEREATYEKTSRRN